MEKRINMLKKRMITVLIAVLPVLVLFGCNQKTGNSETDSGTGLQMEGVESSEKMPVIAVTDSEVVVDVTDSENNPFSSESAGEPDEVFDDEDTTGSNVIISEELKCASNLMHSDDRADFESDEVFANFRSVHAGDMKDNTLYRSASPVDNSYQRAATVDKLCKDAGIKFILDIADDEESMAGHMAEPDFKSDYFKSLYESGNVALARLRSDYTSEGYASKTADALRTLLDAEGPILIHCSEGKDRTGFVCVLLEALCGASYNEIKEDYMLTYENYYGIDKESKKADYNMLVKGLLKPMLQTVAGSEDADVKNADLKAGAERFLKEGGMTDSEIEKLRSRLTE